MVYCLQKFVKRGDTVKELELLLSAVRHAVLGVPFEALGDDAALDGACALALSHDLAPIALEGLSTVALPTAAAERLLRRSAALLSRFYAQTEVTARLFAAFEAEHIDYMPLKGFAYRGLYPNPEWRVGRDVDVLVRREDFDRARAVTARVFSPCKIGEGSHDVGFETEGGVRLELHFALFNGDEGFGDLLSRPFDDVCGAGHCYAMADAPRYAYHVAHMAKHFRRGGCGIRAFLDLFLLWRLLDGEHRAKALSLLEGAALGGFEQAVRREALVFFGGAEHDADTDRLAAFVAGNHAFGSFSSSAAAQMRRKGKKPGFWSRAFPSYGKMCYLYPVLRGWPILLPFCWIARGFRLFSKKDRARFLAATRAASATDAASVAELGALYEYLHLEG